MNDTIFAPATAAGRGAIAVLRVSGPQAGDALAKMIAGSLPAPRVAGLRRICGGDGEALDEGLVLWMPAPASFTGEDCAELHLHGGPAIVSAVAGRLVELGVRLAQAGEFTRRAFEGGRLDLSQAEAIADLVDAETSAQRRQALAQLHGALSNRYEAWRETLLDALALLEAAIDFPEEEIPGGVLDQAADLLSRVSCEIAAAVDETQGERVREGFRIAIVGAPNVGKSSLLNALAGREAAIVTNVAGTTRDVVEVALVIEGQLTVLADTAGLRETMDSIEVEGVRRARAWAGSADLRIGVADRTRPGTLAAAGAELRENDILVWNKSDLSSVSVTVGGPWEMVATVANSLGVAALQEALAARLRVMPGRSFPAVTRERHRGLLKEAQSHLSRAFSQKAWGQRPELIGEDVRLCIRCLEQVVGRCNPDAVLDRVFGSFCIGK